MRHHCQVEDQVLVHHTLSGLYAMDTLRELDTT